MIVSPSHAPAPELQVRMYELTRLARTAFLRTGEHNWPARTAAASAAELGRELLGSLDGVAAGHVRDGLAHLDRGLATWGTTAREPFQRASGSMIQAYEAMYGAAVPGRH